MKKVLAATAVLAAFIATDASAQDVLNLSGRFICVQNCATGAPGQPAFITQNGWSMDIVGEGGFASIGWIDWPGHIWIRNLQEGAVYSPDGMVIQFDHGTVWQRDLRPGPPIADVR